MMRSSRTTLQSVESVGRSQKRMGATLPEWRDENSRTYLLTGVSGSASSVHPSNPGFIQRTSVYPR
jgi:hypothetical protein